MSKSCTMGSSSQVCKTAFNHLNDTKNRTERNETKFFLQHFGARTQGLSSFENTPGGKRTCWEVDLFARTISSRSGPENEAISLYCSVEICCLGPHAPSVSEDSAPLPPWVRALPASLSTSQSLAKLVRTPSQLIYTATSLPTNW